MTPEEKSAEYLKRLSGREGTFTISTANTSAHAKNFISFYVAEDTVIASLKRNGEATDVKALYISDPAVAIKAGTLKTIKAGYFSEITLTSGSVELILLDFV